MINSSTNTLDVNPIILFYRCPNLGYTHCYQSIPQTIPPLLLLYYLQGARFPQHTNVSTENLDPGTRFHIEFSFFKKVSCQNITSALTIVDATTSHLFGYTTISKRTTIQHTMTFIQFYSHHGYNISIFWVDECGELMH